MVYSSIAELPIFDQYKTNHNVDVSNLIQELEQQNEAKLNLSSCVNDTSVRANELKINYSNTDSQKAVDNSSFDIRKKRKCDC